MAPCRVRCVTVLPLALMFAAAPRAAGMDVVRPVTRTDEAVETFGVTGSGVTVAILDRGIDWTHGDFRHPDGTTRIRRLLDMSGQTLGPCAAGNPAPIEYSEAQINAALSGGPSIATREAVGHGTVTTGIAAGDGSAFAGGAYRGIAPEADLIIVKLVSEGAPAHDGQPAEGAFQGCIDEALDWLDEKVDLLGQPCVALINSGTQWGPIDGTSAVSRKIDEVFGLDRPGRVYVSPAGDEGMLPTHAGGEYDDAAPTVVSMTKLSSATAFMSIWYTGGQPAEVTVTFSDGTSVGPVGPSGSLNQNGVYIIQYAPGLEFYPWQSTSGDRAVWIRITGHVGAGGVHVRGTTPGAGRFDLHHGQLPNVVRFNDHLSAGRLTDYSATLSATVAAAHVARTSYIDINGLQRNVGQQGATGQLWQYSAGGPTRDGRLHGVDLSAPGHNCFAAYAPSSYWGAFDSRLIQGGGGWYGRAEATSGSAPIVVGAVALMLQRDPDLTGARARALLRRAAVADAFTDATPNASWGFGKLDVFEAVRLLCPADITGPSGAADGNVDALDYLALLAQWGAPCSDPCPADISGPGDEPDGVVDALDFLGLIEQWGSPGCA